MKPEVRRYRLAGRCLAVDCELPLATSVGVETCESAFDISSDDSLQVNPADRAFTSWVAGCDRQIQTEADGDTRIAWQVEGIGDFAVDLERREGYYHLNPTAGQQALEELLLGPFAVLMLAADNCFCLHAGGVAVDGHSMLFLGDSGAGKSTLARSLMGMGLERTSDDLAPVENRDNGQFMHSPGFPQLKVDESLQYGLREPQSLEIGGLFFLERSDAARPAAEPADKGWAFEQILRQTMSVKLFNGELLAKHMRFAGELVERVPCWRVAWPHREASIAWMAEFLQNAVK